MRLRDLVQGIDGRLSHSKVWANIGNVILSLMVLRHTWKYGVSAEVIFAYGAVVTGAALGSKFLSAWRDRGLNGNGRMNGSMGSFPRGE